MSDLIDRQAVIDVLATMQGLCTSKTALVQNSKIWQQIKDLPSVDAVEVVRCKDCRWYKTNYKWDGKAVKICAKEAYEPVRKEDDFCSYGERK